MIGLTDSASLQETLEDLADVFAVAVRSRHGDVIGMVHDATNGKGKIRGYVFGKDKAISPYSFAGYVAKVARSVSRPKFYPTENGGLSFDSVADAKAAVLACWEWREAHPPGITRTKG